MQLNVLYSSQVQTDALKLNRVDLDIWKNVELHFI